MSIRTGKDTAEQEEPSLSTAKEAGRLMDACLEGAVEEAVHFISNEYRRDGNTVYVATHPVASTGPTITGLPFPEAEEPDDKTKAIWRLL